MLGAKEKKPQGAQPTDAQKAPIMAAVVNLAKQKQKAAATAAPAPKANVQGTPPKRLEGALAPFNPPTDPRYTVPDYLAGKPGPVKLEMVLPMSGHTVQASFASAPTEEEITRAVEESDARLSFTQGKVHPWLVERLQGLPFDLVDVQSAVAQRRSYLKRKGGETYITKQQALKAVADVLGIEDYKRLQDINSDEYKAMRGLVSSAGFTPESLTQNLSDAGVNAQEAGLIERNPGMALDTGLDTLARSVGTALSPTETLLTLAGDPRSNETRAGETLNVYGAQVDEGAYRAGADMLTQLAATMGLSAATAPAAGAAAVNAASKPIARQIVEQALINTGLNVAPAIPGTISGARDIQATEGLTYGKALFKSAKQQAEGMARQFNPGAIFDESLPMEERVGSALNIGFILLGAAGQASSVSRPQGLYRQTRTGPKINPEAAAQVAADPAAWAAKAADVLDRLREVEENANGQTAEVAALARMAAHLRSERGAADAAKAAAGAAPNLYGDENPWGPAPAPSYGDALPWVGPGFDDATKQQRLDALYLEMSNVPRDNSPESNKRLAELVKEIEQINLQNSGPIGADPQGKQGAEPWGYKLDSATLDQFTFGERAKVGAGGDHPLQNPYIMTRDELSRMAAAGATDATKLADFLRRKRHDGILIEDGANSEYVTFRPKSDTLADIGSNTIEYVDGFSALRDLTKPALALEREMLAHPERFDPDAPEYDRALHEALFRHTEHRAPETPEELYAHGKEVPDLARELDGQQSLQRAKAEDVSELQHLIDQANELRGKYWETNEAGKRVLRSGGGTSGEGLVPIRKGSDGYWRAAGPMESFYDLREAPPEVRAAVLDFADGYGDSDNYYVSKAAFDEWKAAGRPNNHPGFNPRKVSEIAVREGEGREIVRGKILAEFVDEMQGRVREIKQTGRKLDSQTGPADLAEAVKHYLGTDYEAKNAPDPKPAPESRPKSEPKAKADAEPKPRVYPEGSEFVVDADGKTRVYQLGENGRVQLSDARKELMAELGKAKAMVTSSTKTVEGGGKVPLTPAERIERTRYGLDLEREAQAKYHRARMAAIEAADTIDITDAPKQTRKGVKAAVQAAQVAMEAQNRRDGIRSAREQTIKESLGDPATGSEYGGDNSVVTKDEYEAIMARRRKGGGMGGNRQRGAARLSPEDVVDLFKIGAYHFEANVRNFAKWSAAVLGDMAPGKEVEAEARMRLRAIWNDLTKRGAERTAASSKERAERMAGFGTAQKNRPKLFSKGRSTAEAVRNWFEQVYADSTHEAKVATELLASAMGVPYEQIKNTALDLHMQINRMTRTNEYIKMSVLHGVMNADGKKLYPGVLDLVDALKTAGIDLAEYDQYRKALRLQEVGARRLDTDVAKPDAQMLEVWSGIVNQFLERHGDKVDGDNVPVLDKIHQMTMQMFDGQLSQRERYGLELPGYSDRIREENPHYWPLKEVVSQDEAIMRFLNPEGGVGSNDDTIRALGRDVEYFDGFSGYAMNLERTLREGLKNDAYVPFLLEASEQDVLGSVVRLAKPEEILGVAAGDVSETAGAAALRAEALRDKSIVKFYKDGQPIYFKVDPLVWDAMRSVDPVIMRGVARFMQMSATVFKAGTTTANPFFKLIHNPILDTGSAIVNHGLNPLKRAKDLPALVGQSKKQSRLASVAAAAVNSKFVQDNMPLYFKAMIHAAQGSDSELFRQWVADMGSANGKSMRDFETQQMLFAEGLTHPEITKASNQAAGVVEWAKDGAKNLWDKFERLSNIGEEGVRLAMYLQELNKDAPAARMAASQAGAELMNFGRAGQLGRTLSMGGTPYASIPGQAFYQMREGFRKNPKAWVARASVLALLKVGEVLAYDGDPEYDNLPDYQKDRGLLVKNPLGGWFMLPMDNAIGAVFFAMPRRAVLFAKSKLGALDAVGGELKALVDAYVPMPLPTPAKVAAETAIFGSSGAVVDTRFGNVRSYPQDMATAKDEQVQTAWYRFLKQQVGNVVGSGGRDAVQLAGYFFGKEEYKPSPFGRYTPEPKDVRDKKKGAGAGLPNLDKLLNITKGGGVPSPDQMIKDLVPSAP
jgi:hypothetical protein